jgi:hypothetical protein
MDLPLRKIPAVAVVGSVWLQASYGVPQFGGQTLRNARESFAGYPLPSQEWGCDSFEEEMVVYRDVNLTFRHLGWQQREEEKQREELGNLARSQAA